MKNYMTLLAFGVLFVLSQKTMAQDYESSDQKFEPPTSIYLGADALVAIPQGSLKEFSKTTGGIRLELGIPFKSKPSLSVGLEFSGIFSGSKNDKFKGLDVNTGTMFISLSPFLRWAPQTRTAISPFFDFSMGIMGSCTETTSEVVDEATFLEQVLFGAEDEVETVTHESNNSSNFSLGVGAGVTIKKLVRLGVRYHHTYSVDYIDMDKVSVKDASIHYEADRIPIDMIVITVGFVIGKVN